MEYFIAAYKNNYANFSGRARRKEYWMFTLFYIISIVVLTIIDTIIGTMNIKVGLGVLGMLFVIASFLPSISIAARRLHDTNKSGWWQLLALVPVVGPLVLFIFYIIDSNPGQNRFGENPKGN